ncbi:phage-shock protein [Kordiimonas sediminis]|uniref:Phage-shock protein n=1 Tax=Kordiimonas sediminis TaxID=1735581 RepID=A0A919E3P3_9PROT|nr:envelope stress response membrane protein PspC [Kordiimonas sediminis]GHF16463.1 phage-shock protein [Kordiimonas sediminis]
MTYKNRPTRLYKIPPQGNLMGVCAGVADYLDINVTAVRVLSVIGALMTGIWLFVIGYVILGFVLDPKPEDLYEDETEEEFWKQTRTSPEYSAAEMRKRFRDIERRTSDMEAYMTSKRFKLERELRALED